MTFYECDSGRSSSVLREEHVETGFIGKLQGLKYEYRRDIINRATLEENFREKFEDLNRVRLTDGEFARLLDEIITPDVFAAAIRDGYTRFNAEKDAAELATIASQHHLATAALQAFVDGILQRMIFDGEHLSDLMAPLKLGWKARTHGELALMADLHPPAHQTRRGARHLRTQRV